MKKLILVLLVVVVECFAQQPAPAKPDDTPKSPEINTALMESTFMVKGPSARPNEEHETRFGSGFIMMRPTKEDPTLWNFVLITAKHVFEDIKGDKATLNGDIEVFPWDITIRSAAKNLYTVHPSADVAAIDVNLPTDSIVVKIGKDITNENWLASDDFVSSIAIHPGDDILCLGFPLGIQLNGYPVLRSGKIASYPVTPLKKVGAIAYDFRVYPGNSGGPAYFSYSNRPYNNSLSIGTTYQKIFGIVTQQANTINNVDPSIGLIVPSVFIKETIDLLAGFETKIKE